MTGFAGQLSLGHSLYLGIGAYASAALYFHFGIGPWAGLWLSIVFCGLVGAFVGALAFRYGISGVYFTLQDACGGDKRRNDVAGGRVLGLLLQQSFSGADFQYQPFHRNHPWSDYRRDRHAHRPDSRRGAFDVARRWRHGACFRTRLGSRRRETVDLWCDSVRSCDVIAPRRLAGPCAQAESVAMSVLLEVHGVSKSFLGL